MKVVSLATAGLLCALAGAVQAATPDVLVEGVNMPAWVTRGGRIEPLGVGARLKASDEITTAEGSRVLLRLADGSAVKLGENARFVVGAAAQKRDGANPLFQATLRVLAGAFRFTTAALAKVRSQRDVTIEFPTVTAGVRGTDLWGKAGADRDFVVLIEGKIGVKRGDEAEVAMNESRSLFDAPKGAPTPPLSQITPDLLDKYAAETEISAGSGAAQAGGRWKVTVAASESQSEALGAYDKLRGAGYAAAIAPLNRDGKTRFMVRIGNLASEKDALQLALRLKLRLGFEAASVSM